MRLLLAVLIFAVSMPAFANRGAALVPLLKPEGAPELRDRFHNAIVRGLAGTDDEVLAAAETRMRLSLTGEELLICNGQVSCVGQAASTLRTLWLVTSEITINGKDYAFRLRLVEANGRELASIEQPCDVCTIREAEEALQKGASRLVPSVKRLHNAPASAEAPKPSATKAAAVPPKVAPVTQAPVTAAEVDAPVPPAVQMHTPEPPRSRPLLWTGLGVLGAGVIAIGVGAKLVTMDGTPTCSLPNPATACPNLYNTVGGGATLLVIGSLSLVGSAVLFVFDYRAQHPKPVPVGFHLKSWLPNVAYGNGAAQLAFEGTF